ncbi:Ca-activated chloride channel family protein [Sagittula marina]|uniref:Ca-activated chloride channel family protein n=1 Tax=Sagittula marina TaxID=943940 RepID=A0A7W6DV35_9RHOB|nr:VWA domain-containing protein [Sagittula marina]MBB3987477.1 Ca-activated chloride channel family protein [Sagittula marina]
MPELAFPLALLLLPLPWLAARLLPAAQNGGAALEVPDSIADALLAGDHARGSAVHDLRWLRWGIWVLAVLALSGPRMLEPVPALKVSGRDMAVVLDLSGSMVREDFYLDGRTVTRLEAVTQVGAEFARRRAGDRVALIVFGSEAYYAAPFTYDVEGIAQQIEKAQIGVSGRATNISDGLGLALKRMAKSEAASRVVILLSDGKNNAGATNPRGVAQLAAQMGVRVHTIALGPEDLETAGEDARGAVDAATLRAMSEISGGESFRVKTTDDLLAVTEALDQLEATDSDGLAAEVWRALWLWPAGLAALLLAWLGWREAQA